MRRSSTYALVLVGFFTLASCGGGTNDSQTPEDCSLDVPDGKCPQGQVCVDGQCQTLSNECAPDNPDGDCPQGQSCVEGTCVTPVEECSPSHPDGSCPGGQVCLNGGCVAEADLCTPANSSGLCPDGQACLEGHCLADELLCSADNPTGLCPSGLSCLDGVCTQNEDPCSADNPSGVCPNGEYCLDGSCIAAADLCSAANPVGICPAGYSCLNGSCVNSDELCSAGNPDGQCPGGQVCFEGSCVAETDLCSADNPAGLCPPGQICLDGACGIDEDSCSADNPDGPCPDGQICWEGACVAESDLCSADNPTGLCPSGQSCLEGACVADSDLCSADNPLGLCPGSQSCYQGACIECGNGLLEGDEICDGEEVPCAQIDFWAYVEGTALCLDDCSGFDLSACQGNIELEEGMTADIQTAAMITGMAQMEVMGMDLIGLYEWEVKEVIDQVFDANGADTWPAFAHIVASGPNAISLHYSGGDRMIQDGDLLLMDLGAQVNSWCGDITRTIPANGTYSDRQRELYQLVLDCQTAVAETIQPEVTSLNEANAFANQFFAASPLRALDENGNERTMDYFFIHGISHYIGKLVHGEDLWLSTSDPVPIGYVFSIEPGLYIESEGIGIRIEDDYIMTESGAVNVFRNTPKTVEEVESWMQDAKFRGFPGQVLLEWVEEPDSQHGGFSEHMMF